MFMMTLIYLVVFTLLYEYFVCYVVTPLQRHLLISFWSIQHWNQPADWTRQGECDNDEEPDGHLVGPQEGRPLREFSGNVCEESDSGLEVGNRKIDGRTTQKGDGDGSDGNIDFLLKKLSLRKWAFICDS